MSLIPSSPSANLLPACADRDWTLWAAPLPFRPRGGVESLDSHPDGDGAALGLHLDEKESYGRLIAYASGIDAGQCYLFRIWQRVQGVDGEMVRVPLILTWLGGASNRNELQRDYVDPVDPVTIRPDGWGLRTSLIQAPTGANSVRVELGLRWAAGSSVWWVAPQLEKVPALPPRKARIAVTRIQPPTPTTVEQNFGLMMTMFDQVATERPDLVLFSENLVDFNTRRPVAETAQSIPGPLTRALGERARRHGTYVATTLHEVDGERYFNTAVLIDRKGEIVGTYRKVHLAMTEAEEGILPGDDYPVFQTDFGTVGILICWDNWFPEAARLLRLAGAEILLLPIAGDGTPGHWEAISRARALDNGVYLISSAIVTDISSQIINPVGEILAKATGQFGFAVAEIDLNRKWRVPYLSVGPGLGEGRSLYLQERRPDTYRALSQ